MLTTLGRRSISLRRAAPPADHQVDVTNIGGGALLTILRKTIPALAVVAAFAVPAAAAADDAVSVCNEAENSHRGGYVVSGGPEDPNPPAFLRGSQMRVGSGDAEGLERAAEQSPALRTCEPEDGDGGEDPGPIIIS